MIVRVGDSRCSGAQAMNTCTGTGLWRLESFLRCIFARDVPSQAKSCVDMSNSLHVRYSHYPPSVLMWIIVVRTRAADTLCLTVTMLRLYDSEALRIREMCLSTEEVPLSSDIRDGLDTQGRFPGSVKSTKRCDGRCRPSVFFNTSVGQVHAETNAFVRVAARPSFPLAASSLYSVGGWVGGHRCFVAFQELDGCNVILFVFFVNEVTDPTLPTNNGRVYLRLVDSVGHFRPRG